MSRQGHWYCVIDEAWQDLEHDGQTIRRHLGTTTRLGFPDGRTFEYDGQPADAVRALLGQPPMR